MLIAKDGHARQNRSKYRPSQGDGNHLCNIAFLEAHPALPVVPIHLKAITPRQCKKLFDDDDNAASGRVKCSLDRIRE